jgi:deoxyhypusine synthase
MSVVDFMERHYTHMNGRATLASAEGYHNFTTEQDGKMVVALAGAMSTAEIGKSLAPMIRADKVSAISSTGANIEEDIFNLLHNNKYKMQPNWRELTMADDEKTRDEGFNRVTDTCIPEDVMLETHAKLRELWQAAGEKDERYFHWEYFYQMIRSGYLEDKNDIPMEDSWVVAASEKDIPIYTPGKEDSTIGNMFTADVMRGKIKNKHSVLKSGTEEFEHLTNWYEKMQKDHPIGFFQIGGGIAGDFAMCVVPGLIQDHEKEETRRWRYFSHIGDAVTSYGGYSGCPANEKVTWHKLDTDTERHVIESDATIVAPLIFEYVMEKHKEMQSLLES